MNRDMIIDIKCFRKSVKPLRDNDGGSRVSDLFDEISHFTTCPISPPRTLFEYLLNYLYLAQDFQANTINFFCGRSSDILMKT